MWSNCLVFAVTLWWRRGGYLVIRRSRWGWFPHFLHGTARADGRVRVVSYVPRDPRRKVSPAPVFRGRVQWGDP
jgi:hypothetical protein